MARPPPSSPPTVVEGLSADELGKRLGYAQQMLQRATSQGLTNGLTFRDNFMATVRQLVVTIPATQWISPTLQNSWVAYDSGTHSQPGYRIEPDGTVWIRGVLKDGVGVTLWTLPAGYRPDAHEPYIIYTPAGVGEYFVRSDGTITYQSGGVTFYPLGQRSFKAKAPCAAPAAFTGNGWPISFDTQLRTPPQAINVMGVEDITTLSPVATRSSSWGNAALQWQLESGTRVKLLSATGLSPGRTYRLTLLSHAG